MPAFGKLLVAVDKSGPSDRAVRVACDLARLSQGELELVHVREHEIVAGPKAGGTFEVEDDAEVEKLVDDELAVAKAAGVGVRVRVIRTAYGHAAQAIVAAAEEDAADAIVMGTRGRSEVTALLLGSTAYKVLHLARCPVLVVH